ncbi:putative MFS family arabinose efflux permease [Kribbella sp. VKM Ac-2527]|uniref:Putative MFS family arabinose efflux permease n=1 Tax=Kribbella caucasensis TaxID=2512215 RepID=A0A4R6JLU9_9ACTN|nr:MFS transporter [Kribbella sp. VKM Ac-2527]TDO36291.1 putative MFS family arabinose efflux permease [Kribbella sp. VKM Ac-2527]
MVEVGQVAGLRSRWVPVAAFALVGAATQLVWLNFAGVTTVAAERYGVSENAIGWLAQVFPLLYVVLAIPAGLVLDRWFRSGLIVGAVLTALGALLRLIGDDYSWLLIGQLVASVAQPLVLNAVTGITGRYLVEKDRATGIAVGTASIFAGMVLAFVLSAVFPASADLPVVLRLSAIFSVVAAVVVIVALRKRGSFRVERGRPDRSALKVAWGDPLIRRLCVLAIFPFGVFVALTTFAQALLEPAGVSGGTASTILLVNVVAGVVGSAVIPVLVVRRHAESALLVISLAGTALACVALAVEPGVVVGFVAITLIGFLLLPALPIVLELVERRTGEADGTGAGLIWMAGNLGGLLVATAVGLLVDHPLPAFLVMAAVALIAVPGARALRSPIASL